MMGKKSAVALLCPLLTAALYDGDTCTLYYLKFDT